MISKEEQILHDYFDNLLSPTEQHKFEEALIDNIDLAIELGKLKNLHRNLRNLTSNFEPGSHVIDNIIDSLLEEKKSNTDSEKQLERKKKEKKKKEKKEKKKLKAKTKYRLNQLFTLVLVLMIIASAIWGYLYFKKENTTFPWKIDLLKGEISNYNETFLASGIHDAQTFSTQKNEEIKLIVPSKAVIEISEESKIVVMEGTQSLNSIKFISGKLNFIPYVGNEIFNILVNQITLQSSSAEFEISSLEGKLTDVFVKSNYLKVFLKETQINVPYNHIFQIYNSNEISIPLSVNINKKFAKLIEQYSLTRDESLISKILNAANRYNAFSLYFLLSDVHPIYREMIINKLAKLFPLPENISSEDVLILDDNALQYWWDKIYREM
jgi:hypothetical protein